MQFIFIISRSLCLQLNGTFTSKKDYTYILRLLDDVYRYTHKYVNSKQVKKLIINKLIIRQRPFSTWKEFWLSLGSPLSLVVPVGSNAMVRTVWKPSLSPSPSSSLGSTVQWKGGGIVITLYMHCGQRWTEKIRSVLHNYDRAWLIINLQYSSSAINLDKLFFLQFLFQSVS